MNSHDHPRNAGLPLDRLALVPHDPAWETLFAREAARLARIPGILAVEHIGSTALPDILAKPIVDIAAMAVAFDDSAVNTHLLDLGYACHGEYGLSGRMFFTLGDPPVIHLHVVSPGSVLWTEWLTFRDHLRQHPEIRRSYEAEKRRLFAACKGDRHLYTEMKAPFIKRILNSSGANEESS